MSLGERIICQICGQTMLLLFYTTHIGINLAQYEIFCAKVCDIWQG